MLAGVAPRSGRPLEVDYGATIEEIVRTAFATACDDYLDLVRVTVGTDAWPRSMWPYVKPKPGTQLILRPIPAGGNLRSILSIAVSVAALALGQFYAVPLAGALGLSVGTAQAIITGGIGLIGALLINLFVPVPEPKRPKEKYRVEGWENQFRPGSPIPLVMGKIRYAPPYAARPYTEQIGDDTYCTVIFNFGYGPLKLDKTTFKIGDDPLYEDDGVTFKFDGVDVEVREGYASDDPITLYPEYVWQEFTNSDLIYEFDIVTQVITDIDPKPVEKFTSADVTKFSIDLSFPNGLVHFSQSDGNTDNLPIYILIEYRLNGAGAYTVWDGGEAAFVDSRGTSIPAKTLRIDKKSVDPFAKTVLIQPATRGLYQVRVTRMSPVERTFEDNASRNHSKCVWSVLRSFRPEYPLNFNKPLALVAIKIKATRRLNGMLSNFNAVPERRAKSWNGSAWVANTVTSNPADLLRWFRQGPSVRYPRTDAEMHLDHPILGIEEWADYCTSKGLKFNHAYDDELSVWDVMTDIARAGRATPHDDGYRLGVTVDKPRAFITAYVTAANSWGFSGDVSFPRLPDAFRVPFLDETNKYEPAERIIPKPGFVGTPEVIQELQHVGVTSPDRIWSETRRYWYELQYRPDTWTTTQDFESLAVQRGDRVVINHDILARRQVSGRVVSVSGASVIIVPPVTMEAGITYAVIFRTVPADQADGEAPYGNIVRTVTTTPGEVAALTLTGTGSSPAADDLFMFGESSQLTFDAIVKTIERGDGMTARITMTNHASQIDALVDADTPPTWDGRVGEIIAHDEIAPATPVVVGVSTDGSNYNLKVAITAGATSAPIGSYEVRHRIVGAGSWVTNTASGASGTVLLVGAPYVLGDDVEYQARAVSWGGSAASGYTTLADFVAGSDLAVVGAAIDVAVSLNATSQPVIVWTNSSSSITAAHIWRATTGSGFGAAIEVGSRTALATRYVDSGASSGSQDYWVVLEVSGSFSAESGPVTIIVP